MGPRVEQFERVDAGGGRTGDVADVVGAGALCRQAEIDEPFEEGRPVLGGDLAHLEIGAGGDVAVAAAQALGEIGNALELPGGEDAVGNAQAAHVAVLRGRHVEQPVIAPAEIVVRLGIEAGPRLLLEARIGVEGMLGRLPLLLVDEFAAGRDGPGLRLQMLAIGARRRGRRRRLAAERAQPPRRAGGLHAGHEAFEIALLLGGEVVAHVIRFPQPSS